MSSVQERQIPESKTTLASEFLLSQNVRRARSLALENSVDHQQV